MRRVILVLSLLLTLAAPRLRAEEPEEAAPFRPLLEALQRAARQGGGGLVEHFDMVAATHAIEEEGAFDGLGAADRSSAESALRAGLPIALQDSDLLRHLAWFEIRRVLEVKDGRAVLFVRHRDANGWPASYRWYLTETDEGWRFYDFEELSLSLRFTTMAGLGLRAALDSDARRSLAAVHALSDAAKHLDRYEFEEAEILLSAIAPASLPDTVDSVRLTLLATCRTWDEEYAAALTLLDEAETKRSGEPLAGYVRATALNGLGRHAEALQAAQAYVAMLEADAGVQLVIGQALRGLGRREEALAVFRKGLAEDPDDPELVGEFACALPVEEKSEAIPHFQRMRDAADQFEAVAEVCLERADAEALERLLAIFRTITPEHPDSDYYGGHVHLLHERWAPAAAAFRRGWGRVEDPEERDVFIAEYVGAMLEAGESLKIFEEVPEPERRFGAVAGHLSENGDRKRLDAVLAWGRTRVPAPHDLALWEAEPAWLAGRYEEVATRMLPILDAVGPTPEDSDTAAWEAHHDLLWGAEDRLVRSWIRLGRLEAALELARRIDERDADPSYLLLVHLGRGDVEAAARAATRLAVQPDDGLAISEDEDAVSALREAKFAPVLQILRGE